MRTERRIAQDASVGLVLLAGLLLLVVISFRVGLIDLPRGSSVGDGTLPPLPSGLVVSSVDANGKISRDAAIEVARSSFGDLFDHATVGAYLVALTDTAMLGRDPPMKDRAVWLIVLSNFSEVGPMPFVKTSEEPLATTHAYIYVDAITGDWLATREQ
jgi:hypothetical protein